MQHSAPAKFMADAQKGYRKQEVETQINKLVNGELEQTEEGKGKQKLVFEVEEDDSDDEALQLGDLIQPGCDMLNVGPSKVAPELNDNDRRILCMQHDEAENM